MSIGNIKLLPDGISWGQEAITLIKAALGYIRDASTTVAGLLETATDAEAQAWTATDKALVPSNLDAIDATDAQYIAKTETKRFLTPANLAALPTFSAHKNGTDQGSITSATPVKVTFTTELWDVGGYYDAANSKWTPPAGKYRISARVKLTTTNAVANEIISIRLYKNGSLHRQAQDARASSNASGPTGAWLVSADGDDYYEMYVVKSGAGDGEVEGDSFDSYFEGEAIS